MTHGSDGKKTSTTITTAATNCTQSRNHGNNDDCNDADNSSGGHQQRTNVPCEGGIGFQARPEGGLPHAAGASQCSFWNFPSCRFVKNNRRNVRNVRLDIFQSRGVKASTGTHGEQSDRQVSAQKCQQEPTRSAFPFMPCIPALVASVGSLNLPGWCWAEIQQFALVGSSSSLHSEACNALGASDGVIHSRISQEVVCFRAAANTSCHRQAQGLVPQSCSLFPNPAPSLGTVAWSLPFFVQGCSTQQEIQCAREVHTAVGGLPCGQLGLRRAKTFLCSLQVLCDQYPCGRGNSAISDA